MGGFEVILHGGQPVRLLTGGEVRGAKPTSSYPVKLLVEEFTIPSLRINGTIIDIETTELDPEIGELITFGYISGSKLKSLTRTREMPHHRFLELIRREISLLRRPFYAYNKEFEQRWMDYHGLVFSWRDLMTPLKRNANLIRERSPYRVKWSKLHEAFPIKFLRYFGVKDFDVENEEIGRLWEEHLETGEIYPLMRVTQHNVLDLLTEATTLIWETTLTKLSDNIEAMTPEELSGSLSFRCDVCGKVTWDSTELVYTQRVERKDDGTYRLIEMEVCKDCFRKLMA